MCVKISSQLRERKSNRKLYLELRLMIPNSIKLNGIKWGQNENFWKGEHQIHTTRIHKIPFNFLCFILFLPILCWVYYNFPNINLLHNYFSLEILSWTWATEWETWKFIFESDKCWQGIQCNLPSKTNQFLLLLSLLLLLQHRNTT